jgi:hypothetical protein
LHKELLPYPQGFYRIFTQPLLRLPLMQITLTRRKDWPDNVKEGVIRAFLHAHLACDIPVRDLVARF